jgi:hypothetical protein
MPKATIQVDKQKLTDLINLLEKQETFTNRSALFQKVSEKYSAENGIQVSPSVIYLRVKQFSIPLKTEKSKFDPSRFREKLNNIAVGDDTITPKAKQTTSDLLEYADTKEKEKYLKVAKSTLRGSRKSCIRMMCLQCSNWQPKEIKNCPCVGCAIYLFRPYQ